MKTYQLFIDGQYVDPVEKQWFDSVDPYRGEAWARIPRSSVRDVDAAVAAANEAMWNGPWSRMTATARGKVMRRLGDLVAENAEKLAETEVRDNGKLMAEMLAQVKYHSEWWWYFAGLADKIEGNLVPIDKPEMFAYTTHQPVGVVAALTAWNSPLLFIAWKCAAALAAGCAVIVKPSEFASASTLEFAGLTREAGLPDGMFNVITGFGAEAGAALVEHDGIAKISFTGSDTTGARIYEKAASKLKRVSLELGGKSPNIIFEDADIDAAVAGAISGIFAATGQTCIAGSRLLVQNSIKDQVLEKLMEIGRSARIGDPMDLATNIGPVTTPAQYQKILDYIDIANAEGARCILGGKPASGPGISGGQFIEPTIYVDVDNSMRIAREEVFGPVLSVIGFDTEEEAVAIANDTIYGLAAGIWTQDYRRILKLPELLRVGMVWVNTYRAVSYMMPFGGTKASGIGRESGMDAIYEYLETKSVWISTASGDPGNPFIIR